MRPSALIFAAAIAISSAPLAAGDAAPAPAEPKPATAAAPASDEAAALRKQVSWLVGTQLKMMVDRAVTDGDFDRAELLRGFQESEAGTAKIPSQEEQKPLFEKYMATVQSRRSGGFLAENGKKPGVTTTPSGLQYEVVSKGKADGKQPTAASTVKVNYTGTLTSGKVFDSSAQHGGQPAQFPLNGVIKGWTEGLQLMHEGDKFRFVIPGNLAYGAEGEPRAGIGANETLIFEVELLTVVDSPK